MNARLMCEGIRADDRFVRRGPEADALAQHLARQKEAIVLERVRMGIFVAPHHQGCGNLFQRGIAGTLADAIDGALDLTHAAFDRCEAVRYSHAEIVMAMR